jgi:hypothetical protein
MFQKLAKIEKSIQNKFATRHARKEAKKQAIKKIDSMDLEALQTLLNKKTVGSDKVTESINNETKQMTQEEVTKKFGNKIYFAKNEKNNFLHADKGNIDEFIKYADTTKFFTVSTKNGKTRVFHNRKTLNGLAVKHAKKHGWEISQL